jgi:hypothetical protein
MRTSLDIPLLGFLTSRARFAILPEAKVIGSGVEILGMIWIWEVYGLAISFGSMQ